MVLFLALACSRVPSTLGVPRLSSSLLRVPASAASGPWWVLLSRRMQGTTSEA